ncbi:hypothetical protein [Natrinema halophilum]|uniref:Uncharacterized protein n=1 Tax=Natrinema halophilum TaxID=1699371 RepID=A0A7D5KSV1_9EURY|nr:hypothetical protein [Natrinema halophilum]QLG49804.1 LptF/LptG family permease [Natrinema halophilum]
MDEDTVDRTGDGESDETIQWRRDASTSRTVRLLWSFGVGTFFAAIGIVICWRLYRLAGEAAGEVGRSAVLALIAALAATVLALAIADDTERHLTRLTGSISIDVPSGVRLDRAMDAAVGTVAMAAIIGVLMGVGRYVSQNELLAVGAGPFTGLAALFLPFALVALVLASFLQSVGMLDRSEGTIYLYEPKQRVDLAVITDVSIRRLGDAAILNLRYAQPDGQYVQGPRRIVVPPAVARDVAALVDADS